MYKIVALSSSQVSNCIKKKYNINHSSPADYPLKKQTSYSAVETEAR